MSESASKAQHCCLAGSEGKFLHGHGRHGGAQAAFGADAAGRAGGRLFHHRGDDRDAGDAEKNRSDLNQLGGQTFMVAKWPDIYFGRSSGDAKNTGGARTSPCSRAMAAGQSATLPLSVGLEDGVLVAATMTFALQAQRRRLRLSGETPGSFRAQNWIIARGPRCCWMRTWTARATFACWAAAWRTNLFPTVRRWRAGQD